MAFSSTGTLGGASTKTAGTSWSAGFGLANYAQNDLILIVLSTDNVQTTDGVTNLHTDLALGAAGQYPAVKMHEYTNGQGAAAGGTTVSVWYCKLPSGATGGNAFVATFASSIAAKAITAWDFTTTATSFAIAGVQQSATDAAGAGALSLSSLASREYLAVRGYAGEGNTTTASTPTASWTAMTAATSSGGGGATNVGARGEFRVQTATSFSSSFTSGMGNVDGASVIAALYEVSATTVSGSFTADAFISSLVSGSFSADAFIRRTDLSGSFTANAFVKKTDIAGSLTADAYVSVGRTGSLTADAFIKGTLAGSFTANAHVKATVSGSVTADAFVKRTYVFGSAGGSTTVLSDRFDGAYGALTAHTPNVGSAWVEQYSVSGGHQMVSGSGFITWDGVVTTEDGDGMGFFDTYTTGGSAGDATMDVFFGGGGPAIAGYTFRGVANKRYALVVTYSAGAYQLQVFRVDGGVYVSAASYALGVGSTYARVEFSGSAPTAIKVKVSVTAGGLDAASYVINTTDNAAGYQTASGAVGVWSTGQYDYWYSSETPPFVLADMVVTTTGGGGADGPGVTADAYISKAVAGTFTADALVKRIGLAGSFTADALIRRLDLTGSLTADAYVKRLDQPGSFTADAFIARTASGTFTTDAYIRRLGLTGSLTADAFVRTTTSGSFSANANIRKTDIAGMFTADAYISRGGSGQVTLDAYIARTGLSGTFSADAYIRRTFEGSFTADAYVSKVQSGSVSADAFIRRTFAGTLTADAFILRAQSGTFTMDAEISAPEAGVVTGSFTANAFIKATVGGALTADAYIKREQSGSFVADAYVRRTFGQAIAADAFVLRTQAGSFAADAFILRTYSYGFTADAMVSAVRSGSFTLNAEIAPPQAGERLGSFSADAYIKRAGLSGSFTADAYIGRTTSGSLTADAFIRREQAAALTADAFIARTATGSFTVDAFIARVGTGSLTVDAFIAATVVSAFTLDAIIYNPDATTRVRGATSVAAFGGRSALSSFRFTSSRAVASHSTVTSGISGTTSVSGED